MASPKQQSRGREKDSSSYGPKNSPPIPIKTKGAAAPVTPNNSNENEPPNTPVTMQGTRDRILMGGTLKEGMLPTAGDDLQTTQEESNNDLQSLLNDPALGNKTKRVLEKFSKTRRGEPLWEGLNEGILMELRTCRNETFALPLLVDEESFVKWDRILSESGGYEYDTLLKKLIIKCVPGPMHEGIAHAFSQWFGEIEEDMQEEVEIGVTSNEGSSLHSHFLTAANINYQDMNFEVVTRGTPEFQTVLSSLEKIRRL
jgi:hypothetical protein